MSIELLKSTVYLDANLKAYYRFESGALTTDTTSGGHNLTAISDPAEDASGKFGGAVALDGNDAYSMGDGTDSDFKPTGNFTIGAWVKTGNTGDTFIFYSGLQNTNVAGIRLWKRDTGVCVLTIGKNTGTTAPDHYQNINGSTNIEDSNWHFVVGTWDGSNMRLYIDGASDATAVSWTSAPGYAASNNIRIGCSCAVSTNGDFFTGSLDDVFLLNGTALSAAQISYLYNNSGYVLDASVLALTLTGINIAINRGYELVSSVGEFALTGIDIVINRAINLITDVGSFLLTGININFNFFDWIPRTKPSTSFTARTKPTTNWTKRN